MPAMEFFTFAWITDPEIWLSLITLSALEIVLGIDNLVFIAILTGRLPAHQRALGRKVGLALALPPDRIPLARLVDLASRSTLGARPRGGAGWDHLEVAAADAS
mgnify:CR=1 FL=1